MKTVIVTGASRGIGAATAKYFGEQGFRVIVNYNSSKEAANIVCKAITDKGAEAYPCKADVGVTDDCKALIEYAASFGDGIDVLVNNAAVDAWSAFDMLPIEKERRLFDINLFGMMNCSRFAIPYMVSKKSGAIVNVSSIWGRSGASCEVQYSTSKAAVIGFTNSLAKELAPSDIRVNAVAPGIIDTDMNKNLTPDEIAEFCEGVPMGRMGTPREVAECIYFLATASYVTGQTLGVDGGYI